MEDGRHWCLQRVYQDFYDLQINLIQEFPVEAGNVKGKERTLPYMPGPVTYVTDNISNGRRANLDEYIRNLLKLGPHITKSYLVRKFFAPRQGDYELDPEAADSYRLSSASQDSPNGASSAISPQSSAGNLSQGQSSAFSPTYQQQQRGVASQGQGQGQGHYRTGSMQQAVGTPGSMTGGVASGTSMKIKVWFEQDNCVIIRMPPQFRYSDLYKKLEERRALERLPDTGDLEVMYRDETEGRMFGMANDDDLQTAVQRNPKLTLHVRVR
jgi:bud emergence protein 1